ncbi:MAG: hypothetical protein K0S47_1837 [Herbinix sp.]|jgi:hypothetical protein|nr:hypothetical protein [Herbinix sp.]
MKIKSAMGYQLLRLVSILIILGALFAIAITMLMNPLHNEPKIILEASINTLNEDEKSYIGLGEDEDYDLNNFKGYHFKLYVENIEDRVIQVPDYVSIWNKGGEHIYWSGNSYKQDNTSEEFAQYGYDSTINTTNLDQEEIRELLNSESVRVEWSAKDGSREVRTYRVGDLVEFN